MNPLVYLFLLSFVGSVAGLVGGLVLLIKKGWAHKLSVVATPLAAGVLLALSLLDLLPGAVKEVGDTAFVIVLVVFVVFFLIERFLFFLHHHSHPETGSHEDDSGVLPVIVGDTIHNFLDGVAVAASFMIDPSLGLVVAFSTFLHETPHEIADFGILIANGWSGKKAFGVNFLSALATFPGAFLTYAYASKVESSVGILLSVAAGLFLYVAATDFLPEVGRASNLAPYRQALFLVLGILVIIGMGILVPEM